MKKTAVTFLALFLFISLNSFAQESVNRIEAENYTEIHKATTKKGDGGTIVNQFNKGTWLRFDNVDFGKGAKQIKFRCGAGAPNAKAQLEIRLGDETGKLLGTVDVETRDWKLGEQTIEIPKTKGKQTITILSIGTGVLLNWFEIIN